MGDARRCPGCGGAALLAMDEDAEALDMGPDSSFRGWSCRKVRPEDRTEGVDES